MIEAGAMRCRVEIEKPSGNVDGFGRPDGTYTHLGGAWAEINETTGTEADVANQKVNGATHIITIRHRRLFTLRAEMRFKMGTRVFEIGHVDNAGQINREWIATCKETKS